MSDSMIYLDEAGDMGCGKGTHWFVLTAVIVNKADEKAIRTTMASIKSKLNIKTIHWRNIKNFNHRMYIASELNKHDFQYITILADTNKLDISKIDKSKSSRSFHDIVYNYMCRYLLERASWLLRDTNRTADIMLSSRGTKKDEELLDYMEYLVNSSDTRIVNNFGSLSSQTASSRDLLQLADVLATSMFYAYETNAFGHITPCFAKHFRHKIYSHNGKIENYGIKYLAPIMKPDSNYFTERKICT